LISIPTEPIGSIPRPLELIEASKKYDQGLIKEEELNRIYLKSLEDTIKEFEATGSPVLSDGEQRKYHNFVTYALHGAPNLKPDGFKLQFINHYRQFPLLTAGPLKYQRYADVFLENAFKFTQKPMKQAVIAPSAISLFYPEEPIPGYTREEFITDLLHEHEKEIRLCFAKGAQSVQIDFTEGRLAHKLDPSGNLLNSFIILNNMALNNFSAEERQRIGVHTCPGGDCDSTHSADVDYAEFLPSLFELNAGNFFIALAREKDRIRVLKMIKNYIKPHQRAFVGVIDPLDPEIETPEEVKERVLEAADYIPIHQLGTTDDCGFAPFSDDLSTSREKAFAKIKSRVEGTALAAKELFKKVS
jgi:5-methyltetrahydropteroyltriglutamate--homocysteine methyltransferase